MNVVELIGTAAGVGFLAGIRLYATVFALGLLIRFGLLELSDTFRHAIVLGSTPVLVTSALLTAAEFISDKLPWFDSFWDSIHTFVRPIGAAALAFTSLSGMDPALKTTLVLSTGGVALTSHSAKAATRVAANQSPEPFSNMALSIAEDLFVPLGIWFTVHFPLIVLALVIIFLLVFFWLIRRVVRFFKQRFRMA
jgi:hypothetical protein